MLIKTVSGTLGLLAFAAAILAGLWADNDFTTIMTRALCSLGLFLGLGAFFGWMAQIVIDEHIQKTTQQMMEHLPTTSPAQQDQPVSETNSQE